MHQILDAIESGEATAEDFANLPLPESYRAAFVRKDEVGMFEGLDSRDKDPRRSLHVEEVALPELGPGEAFVAVMASSRSRRSASWSGTAGSRRSPGATTCRTTSSGPTSPAW